MVNRMISLLGSLQTVLETRDLDLREICQVLHQCLKALNYLHQEVKTAHRDIKPANILVVSQARLHVKLCDFGVATKNPTPQSLEGTKIYWPPEMGSGSYSTSVCIWSLGVVALEMMSSLPVFDPTLNPAEWAKVSSCVDGPSKSQNSTADH